VLLILGMSFLWLRPERAWALSYGETFEATIVGDLNGQNSWVANSTNMDVQSSSCQAGSRCVGTTQSDAKGAWYDLGEDIGAYDTVIIGAYMMTDTGNGGTIKIGLATTTETSNVSSGNITSSYSKNVYCAAGMTSSSGFSLEGATTTTYHGSWTANTQYYVELEMNFATDNCRIRIDGGAWSATKSFYVAQSGYSLRYLLFGVGTVNGYMKRIDTISVTTTGGAAEDTTTRFITFTPTLGSATPNATSTSFAFGVTGYINDDDIEDDQYIYGRWRNISHGQYGSAAGCTADDSWGEFESEIATSSNEFTFATTTAITCYGAYGMAWQLKRPAWTLFGLTLWDETVIEAYSTFVVGTTTGGFVPSEEQIGMVDDIFASGLDYGGYIPNEANASSTLFNLYQYLNLREQVASRFPISWGIYTVNAVMLAAQHQGTTTLSSSTIDFGSMTTLQWYATSSPTDLEVDVWTWAWMEDLADNSAWQLLITITIGLMWLGLGLFAWREAQRVFTQATN